MDLKQLFTNLKQQVEWSQPNMRYHEIMELINQIESIMITPPIVEEPPVIQESAIIEQPPIVEEPPQNEEVTEIVKKTKAKK